VERAFLGRLDKFEENANGFEGDYEDGNDAIEVDEAVGDESSLMSRGSSFGLFMEKYRFSS
jgi:hypothetical protein